MIKYLLLLPLFLLLNMDIHDPEEIVYLCKCSEKLPPDDELGKEVRTKIIYIFLTKDKNCCDLNLIAHDVGYKEEWGNSAPDHPGVWGLKDGSRTEIKGADANKLGCDLDALTKERMTLEQYQNHPSQDYPAFGKMD